MRLDKLISNNSNLSRKDVNKLIRKKFVQVNDQIISDPSFIVDENKDIIKINGNEISIFKNIYIVLNKPKGYVCSHSNKDGESILNLIDENYVKNLHIIGRLDKDTTGLVMITNDGSFTHKIKSSKYEIEKEYEVILEKTFTDEMHEKLKGDIVLDNKKIKPILISNVTDNKLNIILVEGKHHQIKRLFNIVNNPVKELKRKRIGKVKLDDLDLSDGEYIFIDVNEYF